jgi:hypothetical protein
MMSYDFIGQINRQQAFTVIKRAAIAGLIAALVVIQGNLPNIVESTTPAGIALAVAIAQINKFLQSGSEITAVDPAKKDR